MSDKKRFVVGPVEEIPPGSRKIIKVSGREIGVFNVDGEFFALRNVCPHMGAPLCHGRTRPYIIWDENNSQTADCSASSGSPAAMASGNIAFEREGEILKCPWHLWEFDMRTGKSMHDEDLQVRTYRAVQEDNELVLYW